MRKAFPWRIFYRLVLIQSFLVLVALAASGLAARYFFKGQFIHQVQSQLRDTLLQLSREMPEQVTPEWCGYIARNTALRFTVISPEGRVLCDSGHDAPKMENHATRPEVADALKDNFGESVRYSSTQEEEMFYGAVVPPSRKVVLRGAIPLTRLKETMTVFDTSVGLVLLLIGLTLVVCTIWSAKSLVFPMGRLLLKTQSVLAHHPEHVSREDLTRESFDEWSELESNIDDIRRDLAAKTISLTNEQFELDTIMGAISDAILAVDPEGNPLFYNSRFELLFGGEELRKRTAKLWGIFRDPDILQAFRGAFKDGLRLATKAIPLEQKGGKKNFFSLSVSPLRDQKGAIYGAVGIFHDVTELKSAEQMRIDFVANVSHELRTPLTSIKGYVDTLISDLQEKRAIDNDFLQVIARNTERLLLLMNDLLDLSSIESADILQMDPIGTRDLTERVANQLRGRLDGKGQSLSWDCEAETVMGDAHRLEQVLVNLLDNASKYTPAGGKISVAWLNDGSDVLLKISDTGPGIPVEHHARLFERFYRVDKARSREQGGTGLGLAIVKHIMQRHEGSIWVESKPGSGSTFLCRFPGPSTSAKT